jgi:ribosome-binding ATPase YchF (GTP1/OBG family)
LNGSLSVIRDETVDPVSDMEIIESEFILADLQTLDGRLGKLKRSQDADSKMKLEALTCAYEALESGTPARELLFTLRLNGDDDVAAVVDEEKLITGKPTIFVCSK